MYVIWNLLLNLMNAQTRWIVTYHPDVSKRLDFVSPVVVVYWAAIYVRKDNQQFNYSFTNVKIKQ